MQKNGSLHKSILKYKKEDTMNFKKIMAITMGLLMFGSANVYAAEEITSTNEKQGVECFQEKVDMIVQKIKEDKRNGHKTVEFVGNVESEIIELRKTVVEENEPNDRVDLADRLYLDETCYGTISDEDDEDYYKISFDESGYLYIRLSSIPDDCDYDLYFFGSENVDRDDIDNSANGAGETERL